MLKKNVLLLDKEPNKEDINKSLLSIQSYLDELTMALNGLGTVRKNADTNTPEPPKETLNVNILGNATSAENDSSGNNIEQTYFKNNYMQLENGNKDLYIIEGE